ncbi:MAG: PEGA domain-containing protein, partial [Bryobacteraceae bacterium]
KQQERAAQAQQLLGEARDLSEKGSLDESLAPLREAHELDPRSSVVRTVLINSLLERARQLTGSDWQGADASLKELLALEPNHSAALSLSGQVGDRRREEFLSQCVAQARRLQAEGDVSAALTVVEQGLGSYPKESRLQQLQTTLQRSHTESTATARSRDLRDLLKIESDAADPAEREGLFERLQTILSRYPGDEEMQGAAAQALAALGRSSPPAEAGGPPATPGPVTPRPVSRTKVMPEPRPGFADAETSALITPTPSVTPVPVAVTPVKKVEGGEPKTPVTPLPPPKGKEAARKKEPPKKKDDKAPPKPGKKIPWMIPAGIAAAAVLGIAAWKAIPLLRTKPVEPPPGSVAQKVAIRATPEGATITVNQQPCGTGSCEMELQPGAYQVEAKLFGYQPATASMEIAAGQTREPLALTLSPLPPMVSISSDMTEAAVTIDGQSAGQLQGGSLDLTNVASGAHTLQFAGGISRAQIQFELAEGAMPRITGPFQTQNVRGVVIANVGGSARVYS